MLLSRGLLCAVVLCVEGGGKALPIYDFFSRPVEFSFDSMAFFECFSLFSDVIALDRRA